MHKIVDRFRAIAVAVFILPLLCCFATAAAAGSDPCPRPAEGSAITPPPDIYSQNGVLNVTLDYYTMVDQWGRTLFCYVTPDGMEAPSLHVNPGDLIKIQLTNMESNGGTILGSGVETVSGEKVKCGSQTMEPTSINIHFHGLNVKPRCHGDEIIRTIVNPGESFYYNFQVPTDEPPGMYWYHAHVHGIASPAVQGGASGALEVEGIANIQPAVAGLPQRFLVFRDQPLQNPAKHQHVQQEVPFWDVSLNFVPVPFPRYVPGVIQMQAGAQEFWRFVNASADTVADLKLLYDGKAQPLQIVAFDGVPTGSQYARHQGTIITQTDVLVPPAGRAEFIVTGPSSSVKSAMLITERINTGPAGDHDTQRPLAQIQLTKDMKKIPKPILPIAGEVPGDRFAGIDDSMVTAKRKLYFSEFAGEHQPTGGATFFITVDKEIPQAYDPNEPPKIITHRGAIEDWTIENHTQEVHEFHIHQIHFQVVAIDGKPVPNRKRQWYDTYQVGYYDGVSKHYPSVTLRMDFRGKIEGEFVYHCHILDHEDAGMMANIVITPPLPPKGRESSVPTHQASTGNGKLKKA